jgi:hypothetical protein
VIGAFRFEHAGRTYTCAKEKLLTPPAGTWWWFTVSSDSNRYAPFEAAAGDTPQSIRPRILAYYERHLRARARPAAQRQQFGRPAKPAARAAPRAPGQGVSRDRPRAARTQTRP